MDGMLGSLVALEILQLLQKKPRLTAPELAEKVGTSTQHIRNTLKTMKDLHLVATPIRGVYLTTELGTHVLKKVVGSPQ